MKIGKLSLLSLASLFTLGVGHASTCVNYDLSTNAVRKISSSFLTTKTPYSFGLSKYDDGTDDVGFYVDAQDTIIYSKDMASTVGYNAENGDCDLTYVHFEHDLTRFKKKVSTCDSVIKNTLAIISENHSILKHDAQADKLEWTQTMSESGPVMTDSRGKKMGTYDFLNASYDSKAGDKTIRISFEMFKAKTTYKVKVNGEMKTRTKQTCFLSSVNVTQK